MLNRVKTLLRPPPKPPASVEDPDDLEAIFNQIETLSERNRAERDPVNERAIVYLRQLAGIALTRQADERRQVIEPDYDLLPTDTILPEVSGSEVTPELIRAAILRRGAVLVRGLVDSGDAERLGEEIDKAFVARDKYRGGEDLTDDGEWRYYDELWPAPPFEAIHERVHIAAGGGVLAADSPSPAFEMIELFDQANLRALVGGYLQEPPCFSAHKTTLRKAVPSVKGAWHQDGKFLGDVNSVNLWLSLSHCGDTAPGMDLVPRRLEEIVDTGSGDIDLDGFEAIVVTQEQAEKLAGDDGILRPIFEPGDAMFFDHLYLHQTASEPEMPNPRYAVESWFFGPSAFPDGYIPLAY